MENWFSVLHLSILPLFNLLLNLTMFFPPQNVLIVEVRLLGRWIFSTAKLNESDVLQSLLYCILAGHCGNGQNHGNAPRTAEGVQA